VGWSWLDLHPRDEGSTRACSASTPAAPVGTGNTVVVVEHNLDVVARADWVIDLGPDGGQVVLEGTPQQLLEADGSFTGEHLRRFVRPEVSTPV
jgi:energy-coupling factor transporter ATP-binding protein EcfA2